MDCDEIISELQNLGSDKYKANVVKMGIPTDCSLGVSTGDVRALAKKVGTSNVLADQLWNTGYHEAKLMDILVYDRKNIGLGKIESLMEDVFSWDLCDHFCKNLILKVRNYETLIEKWCNHEKTYYKRAAYTLMASAAIHEKEIKEASILSYFDMIKCYSDDEREHVKKAMSWALREIGKKDFDFQDKAILLAYELKEYGSKVQIWIAKDALKELEQLVQVEGRGRLITSDSMMGKEQI